jgi:hypothetical protein
MRKIDNKIEEVKKKISPQYKQQIVANLLIPLSIDEITVYQEDSKFDYVNNKFNTHLRAKLRIDIDEEAGELLQEADFKLSKRKFYLVYIDDEE